METKRMQILRLALLSVIVGVQLSGAARANDEIPISVLRASYHGGPIRSCFDGIYVNERGDKLGYMARCHRLGLVANGVEIAVPMDYGYGEIPEQLYHNSRSYISGDSDPTGVCRFFGFDKFISRDAEHWAPEDGRQLIKINRKGVIVAKGESSDFTYLQTITCATSD